MNKLNDNAYGITRDENGVIQEIRPVDYWWNANVSDNMAIYDIGGQLYCAYGWNGEQYTEAFRVLNKFDIADDKTCCLTPVHRFEAEGREPDWDNDADYEIVGFEIG